MVIKISDITTFRQIQESFYSNYPFLKLQFLKTDLERGKAERPSDVIHIDERIRNVERTHVPGVVEILPGNTIDEVEKRFLHRIGLAVQVLCKSDTHWIEPGKTDQLSLRQQNEIGQLSADHTTHPDYDTWIEDNQY